jgi:hypothetical protein
VFGVADGNFDGGKEAQKEIACVCESAADVFCEAARVLSLVSHRGEHTCLHALGDGCCNLSLANKQGRTLVWLTSLEDVINS